MSDEIERRVHLLESAARRAGSDVALNGATFEPVGEARTALLTAIATLRAERDALAKENDTLRGLLGNSAKPCTYCGLAAEDQAKCASGFPGCSRADDQMLSKHFADGYAAEQARAEVERLREALEHLIERADTSDDCQYGTLSTAYVRDIARAALG